MAPLAMQIAFAVPSGLLVTVAAAGYREEWFFPASMVIVGAHYLPCTFLHGTGWDVVGLFDVFGGSMTLSGVALAPWLPNTFATGGWVAGALLIAFAFVVRRSHRPAARPLERTPGAAAGRADR